MHLQWKKKHLRTDCPLSCTIIYTINDVQHLCMSWQTTEGTSSAARGSRKQSREPGREHRAERINKCSRWGRGRGLEWYSGRICSTPTKRLVLTAIVDKVNDLPTIIDGIQVSSFRDGAKDLMKWCSLWEIISSPCYSKITLVVSSSSELEVEGSFGTEQSPACQ